MASQEMLNDENDDASFVTARDCSVMENTATESFYTVVDSSMREGETTPKAPEKPSRRLVDLDFEAPSYSGPSLADLMGVSSVPSSSQNNAKILPDDLSSDEDEFQRNHDEDGPRSLPMAGKELKKRLQNPNYVNPEAAESALKREALQKMAVARVAATNSSSSSKFGTPFDAFFGLPAISAKVSPATFKTYSEEMQKVKVTQVKRRVGLKGDWITMGVIVERGDVKKSATGKEYMIWNISDLHDCQQKPVKVLLFADCVKDHWKIQEGTLIALTNVDCDSDQRTGDVTLKLFKSNQVMEIGQCPLYSRCAAAKKDGERCKSFVNLSVSDHCAFHIQSAANRLASRRGTFNTGAVAMPKLFAGKPLGDFSNYFYQGKMVQTKSAPVKQAAQLKAPIDQPKGLFVSEPQIRDSEKKTLNQIITSGNIHHRGVRNLVTLRNKTFTSSSISQKAENKIPNLDVLRSPPSAAGKPACIRDFKVQKPTVIAAAGPPKLGRCFGGSQTLSLASPKKKPMMMTREEIAKMRAINVIRKKGGIEKTDPNAIGRAKKRTLNETSSSSSSDPTISSATGTPAKKTCFGGKELSKEELLALLNKKSSHEDEVNQENMEKQNAYFNAMEVKERVENSAVELKEIKNCSVVSCKKCGYTNHKQSDYCMQQGHAVHKHKADKRWFKCKSCSSRVICYVRMPTRPCQGCGAMDFQRVGMKDERKAQVKEKLLIRGEEQKFI